MKRLEWDHMDPDEEPLPCLTPETAAQLFGLTSMTLLPKSPSTTTSRARLLARMPPTLRGLEKAERVYSDSSPKTAVGERHEREECQAAAQELLRLVQAYLLLLAQE